ncbi:unnamed protein product [Microthlaspi erraticum]|uniref:Uncharacterized protein n=1 Tax=Microthlaspi erraticum TaxID=1685480 RepID=A0A6D2J0S9_9BRAS|nr:unnamed protein product [Microthlaspi erraticum]
MSSPNRCPTLIGLRLRMVSGESNREVPHRANMRRKHRLAGTSVSRGDNIMETLSCTEAFGETNEVSVE